MTMDFIPVLLTIKTRRPAREKFVKTKRRQLGVFVDFRKKRNAAEHGFTNDEEADFVQHRIQPAGRNAVVAGVGFGVVQTMTLGGENDPALLQPGDERFRVILMRPLMKLVRGKDAQDEPEQCLIKPDIRPRYEH